MAEGIFIQTHQTFAIHAHPHDYWRFSTQGLAALFPPTLGVQILSCHYQYPCRIVTGDDPGQALNPSYLACPEIGCLNAAYACQIRRVE